jgi:hypothetical protein
LVAMSQQPSPRVKPRSTLAKTGSRCDVALVLMAITSEVRKRSRLEALAGHDARIAQHQSPSKMQRAAF